jgi:hypothetical protein
VLGATVHRVKHPEDEFIRNIVVKQVAHRVDEDHPWRIPSTRFVYRDVIEKDVAIPSSELINYLKVRGFLASVAACLNVGGRHRCQSLGHALSVAMSASSADLSTAYDWIPC